MAVDSEKRNRKTGKITPPGLRATARHNFASLLVNLEVEDEWLFLDEEIIIEIIITSRLIGFSGKSFDRLDIVPESQHLKVSKVSVNAIQTIRSPVTWGSFIVRQCDAAHFLQVLLTLL